MRQAILSFLLTEDELKLMESITYLEPMLIDNLNRLKKEDGKFRIKFDSDDLFEILGAAEFVSNNPKSCREKKENRILYNRLKTYLILICDDKNL